MRRLFLVSILLACAASPVMAGTLLKVSSSQRQAMGVRTGVLKVAGNMPLDGLPATVRAPLHESAVVTAPYAGITVAVLAREGTMVKRGQPLAQIQSREAMRLGADLAAARGEYQVARAQAERDSQLLAEGIIPSGRTQAAIARRNAAAARLEELQAARSMAPLASGAAPGTYELRAPLAGRVIERSLRLGEPVGALDKAFMVAEPGRVMLEMQVPARYAASLRLGLDVRTADGAAGTISEVGAAIDRASQTVLVRASVNGEQLLPGQQTSATLLLPPPKNAWALPSSAVAEHDGRQVVFVERNGGFEAVQVALLAQTGDGDSVVTGALAAENRVVVTGTGALKAMLVAGD
ncbi:MAG: efflux RND transporter periplasmic adaptor subunit [Rhodanobacteraceae bacterium]